MLSCVLIPPVQHEMPAMCLIPRKPEDMQSKLPHRAPNLLLRRSTLVALVMVIGAYLEAGTKVRDKPLQMHLHHSIALLRRYLNHAAVKILEVCDGRFKRSTLSPQQRVAEALVVEPAYFMKKVKTLLFRR